MDLPLPPVHGGDFLLLVARTSVCPKILPALDTLHDLRVQLSPRRQLSLAPSSGEHPSQERNSETGSNEEHQSHPGQYVAEDGKQAEGERDNRDRDDERGNHPQENVLQFLDV